MTRFFGVKGVGLYGYRGKPEYVYRWVLHIQFRHLLFSMTWLR
jgi:hypothetical protein